MTASTPRLRVLHVTDAIAGLHGSVGGAEFAARRLLDPDMLSMAGVDPVLVTMPHEGTSPFPFPVEVPATMEDTGLAGLLDRREGWWSRSAHVDPVALATMTGAISRHSPHVVHLHNFKLLSLAAVAAASARGVPVVFSVYDYWALCPIETLTRPDGEVCRRFHGDWCRECLPEAGRLRRASLAVRRSVFDAHLDRVSSFIALSRASALVLEEYGIAPDRIEVIPPVVDAWNTAGEPEGDRLLYAGWIQERKGLHLVLEAFGRVLEKRPSAVLDVVGEEVDPEYGRSVRSMAAGPVTFHGRLDHGELGRLVGRATALCVAETWENMSPIIVLEAMGAGRPVVAFGVGGIPHVIRDGETGFIVDPWDTDLYADRLLALLCDASLARRMSRASRLCYEDRYARPAIAGALRAVYERAARHG